MPLLRGSGSTIVAEPLTQAERDVVYSLLDFERFKKSIAVRVASEYLSKLLLLKDAILKNRTDGALIRLTTPIKAGEAEQGADRRLQAFIDVAVPALAQYLPTKSGKLAKAEMPPNSDKR